MKERPILFSAPMVRAILDGSKTQTRRVVKRQPSDHHWQCLPGYLLRFTLTAFAKAMGLQFHHTIPQNPNQDSDRQVMCPYGKPGDRLWVRESLQFILDGERKRDHVVFAADGERVPRMPGLMDGVRDPLAFGVARSVPSIHMPRWASRILLEIVSVRVERLNEISAADSYWEGIDQCLGLGSRAEIIDLARRMGTFTDETLRYATLWESINGAGSWDANPWVWVVEFKKVNP